MKSLSWLVTHCGLAIIGLIVRLEGQSTVTHLVGSSAILSIISLHLFTLGKP